MKRGDSRWEREGRERREQKYWERGERNFEESRIKNIYIFWWENGKIVGDMPFNMPSVDALTYSLKLNKGMCTIAAKGFISNFPN